MVMTRTDAFGVSKSFTRVNGVVTHLPISQMSAAERAGIKGVHRSSQGMTTLDRSISEAWNRGAAQRSEMAKLPVSARTKKGRPLKIKEGKPFYDFTAPRPGESQRTMAGHVVADSNKETLAHEMTHAEARKPASRGFRFLRHPEKLWGDEARADMAMDPMARMKHNAYWANATSHTQGKGAVSELSPLYREGLERGGGQKYLDVKESIKADRIARKGEKSAPRFSSQRLQPYKIGGKKYAQVSKANPLVNLRVIRENPKGFWRYLTHSPQDKIINPIRYKLHPVKRAKKHESGFYRQTERPAGYRPKHKG